VSKDDQVQCPVRVQKRKWLGLNGMSALPSKAEIIYQTKHVRKGPTADISAYPCLRDKQEIADDL
jgi:hypothetical protein